MLASMRWRILLSFLTLFLVTLLVLGFVLAGRARRDASQGLETRLTTEAKALAASSIALIYLAAPAAELEMLANAVASAGTEIVILRAGGAVLYASPDAAAGMSLDAPEVRNALAGGISSAVRPDPQQGGSELNLAVPIVDGGDVVGVVRMTASRRELRDAVSRVWFPLGIVGAVSGVSTVILGLFLTNSLIASLGRLSAVARRLAAGSLHERVEESGILEARELSEAINQMAEGLETQVRASFEQRDTFGAVIDTMADALLVTDDTGSVTLVNPSAAEMFDLTPSEAIGKSFIELVRDHEMGEVLRKALDAGHSQTGEVVFGTELRTLRVVATPIEMRERPSVLVIIQDLTAVQRLEGMRREFVANVSHEIRTPLASIRAAVEALQGGAMEDKELGQEFLERVIVEVDELTMLVQRLLDLSRVETGRAGLVMIPLDVRQVIAEVMDRLRPQAEKSGLVLSSEFPDPLPEVMADRASTSEVLVNLLGNAVKFTPAGGTVRLTAKPSEGMVEVSVRDTGEGIHPDHLPHVFERFYKADRSRAPDGVGLGLAIAKHLVQAQGGSIWAESVLEEGSVVSFTLPQAVQDQGEGAS